MYICMCVCANVNISGNIFTYVQINRMGSYGILQHPMESFGILRNSMESYGILWNSMESYGILRHPVGRE